MVVAIEINNKLKYGFIKSCGFYQLVMIKRLMLVSCEYTPFTSKKTKEKVEGYKYIFLNEENKYLVVWGKLGTYKGDATEALKYDDTKAKDYPFKLKEFDGEVSEQLVESSETEEKEPESQ